MYRLIALIYAVTGVSGIVGYFTKSQPFAACLMELVIALGTTWLALALGNANSWTCFNAFSRNFIADYAPTVYDMKTPSSVFFSLSHVKDACATSCREELSVNKRFARNKMK